MQILRLGKSLSGGAERLLLRLELGEEAMETLRRFVTEEKIGAAMLRGLGASRTAELAFYDLEHQRYNPFPVDELMEVISFLGNVARGPDGNPIAHVHAVLSRQDGSCVAGHVIRMTVAATLEIDLEVLPGTLHRRLDKQVGLPLLKEFDPA